MTLSTEASFHYRQGEFFCDDVSLASIAERFGTPAYVYSQRTILRNYESLRRTVSHIPGLICYSVKANSHLRILSLLRQAGAGFDVLTTEPPREGNPLLEIDLPNFILTPHTAWASREAMQALADQLIDNIELWCGGMPQNLVT